MFPCYVLACAREVKERTRHGKWRKKGLANSFGTSYYFHEISTEYLFLLFYHQGNFHEKRYESFKKLSALSKEALENESRVYIISK